MRRSSATSAIEAAGESANARPSGAGHPSDGHNGQPRKSAAVKEAAKPVADPRAELRRELDCWCACRRFVFQFSLIAKRQPKPPPSAKKRRGRRYRCGDRRKSRMPVRRSLGVRRMAKDQAQLGLAAVKHAQNFAAERAARTEQQGRAFVALAHVVADAGGGGWPEKHAARASRLQNAPRTQRMGGEMGRVSQRTGGAG